jgi:protein-L-isoaspartate(D-aspartate) O-methyltransferase
MDPNSFARARAKMVDQQLKARGVDDARVLDAMARVPREQFVGTALASQAYSDAPLPIGEKQTISQPYVVGFMTQALQLSGRENVLEIGTGSGYQTAILSQLAARVYSIERHATLSLRARTLLEAMGARNVVTRCGDGTLGWREFSPFEAILVAAGGPEIPPALVDQLADGGRLVIPIGPEREQELFRITRHGDAFEKTSLGKVRFVPLIGRFGWARTTGSG